MKKMEERYIQQLLERFMRGVSTLEEESALADYFREHPHVKPEWKDYKLLFDYINRGMPEQVSATAMETLRHRRLLGWIVGTMAVAAAVVLAFVLFKPEMTDEKERRQVAQRATQTAQKRMAQPQEPATEKAVPCADESNTTASMPLSAVGKANAESPDQAASMPLANNQEAPIDSLNEERELYEKMLREMQLAHADAEIDRKIDEVIQRIYLQQRELLDATNEFPFEDALVVEVIPM